MQKQLAAVAVALMLLIPLAVLVFAWPAARSHPRNLAVGVVGTSAQAPHVRDALRTQRGDYSVVYYGSESAARSAVERREVYGAFVPGPPLRVLTATAASPSVAQLLVRAGDSIAGASGGAVDDDVVPISQADPNGSVFAITLLPLTVVSVMTAAGIGFVTKKVSARWETGALIAVAAVAAAGVYLVAQTWLGALPHHGVATWASLMLATLAISATASALTALFGTIGAGVAGVLLIFIGNATAATMSAPELLPGFVRIVGQSLPPGAGANAIRGVTYFDGHRSGGHLIVLAAWVVVGLATVVVVRRRRAPENARPDDHGRQLPDPSERVAS